MLWNELKILPSWTYLECTLHQPHRKIHFHVNHRTMKSMALWLERERQAMRAIRPRECSKRERPSSDELIELDFDLAPSTTSAEDDEWSSFTTELAPVEARTTMQMTNLQRKKKTILVGRVHEDMGEAHDWKSSSTWLRQVLRSVSSTHETHLKVKHRQSKHIFIVYLENLACFLAVTGSLLTLNSHSLYADTCIDLINKATKNIIWQTRRRKKRKGVQIKKSVNIRIHRKSETRERTKKPHQFAKNG